MPKVKAKLKVKAMPKLWHHCSSEEPTYQKGCEENVCIFSMLFHMAPKAKGNGSCFNHRCYDGTALIRWLVTHSTDYNKTPIDRATTRKTRRNCQERKKSRPRSQHRSHSSADNCFLAEIYRLTKSASRAEQ